MLIECTDCKTSISPKAVACPKCGAPVEQDIEASPQESEPPEWIKYGIVIVISIAGVFLFRATIFDQIWGMVFRLISALSGDSGFMTDLNLFFADYTGLKADFWTGYFVPFLAIFQILLWIMKPGKKG